MILPIGSNINNVNNNEILGANWFLCTKIFCKIVQENPFDPIYTQFKTGDHLGYDSVNTVI